MSPSACFALHLCLQKAFEWVLAEPGSSPAQGRPGQQMPAIGSQGMPSQTSSPKPFCLQVLVLLYIYVSKRLLSGCRQSLGNKLPKTIHVSKYLFCFTFMFPKGFRVGAGRAWELPWTRRARPANVSQCIPSSTNSQKQSMFPSTCLLYIYVSKRFLSGARRLPKSHSNK